MVFFLEVSFLSQNHRSPQESNNFLHTSWPHLDDLVHTFRIGVTLITLNIEVALGHTYFTLVINSQVVLLLLFSNSEKLSGLCMWYLWQVSQSKPRSTILRKPTNVIWTRGLHAFMFNLEAEGLASRQWLTVAAVHCLVVRGISPWEKILIN